MRISVFMLFALVAACLFTKATSTGSSHKKPIRNPVTKLTYSEEKLYQDEIFQKTPLFYYHIFAANQGHVSSSKKPTTAHYENERQLRLQHFKFKHDIAKLREQKVFATGDLKHEILKLENHKISLQEKLKFFERRVAQRETAIKFQIDHDFAWRTFYKRRYSANQKNLAKALPDELESLELMITFDKERATYWYDSATQQFMLLKKRRSEDRTKHESFITGQDEVEDKILELKLELSHVVKNTDTQIQTIAVKDEYIMKMLAGDVLLDTQKLENDKLENEKVENDRAFEINGPEARRGGNLRNPHGEGIAMGRGPIIGEARGRTVMGPRAEPRFVPNVEPKVVVVSGPRGRVEAKSTAQENALAKEMAKDVKMIKSVKIKAKGTAKVEAKLKADAQKRKIEKHAEKKSA